MARKTLCSRGRRGTQPFGALALCAMLGVVPVAPSAQSVPDARETVGPVTSLPLPRFVSIRAETANARRGPALDQRIDWVFVHRGLPVEVTAEYGQWRRIRDAEGAGGWVNSSLLTGTRTVLVQGDAPVPLRADARAEAQIRAVAEPGVIARLSACDARYCEITAGEVTGWAARDALWGIGATEIVTD